MAAYKINGYDLYEAFGIVPDADRTTTDSFEALPDVEPVFSHDWGNGIIEYDLVSTPALKPRVLTVKGTLVAKNLDEYNLIRLALSSVLYQNYVTLEQVDLSLKYNAKLKPGGANWHRLTNYTDKVVISVSFQFDEVKQAVPFKNSGTSNIYFRVNNELKFYNTQDNRFILKS